MLSSAKKAILKYSKTVKGKEALKRANVNYRKRLKTGGIKIRRKHDTIGAKYRQYKHSARTRGVPFALTREQFQTFWQRTCYYTGWLVSTIGLDRVDSSKGYTIDNIVACHPIPNKAKSNLPSDTFIKLGIAICKKHGPCSHIS